MPRTAGLAAAVAVVLLAGCQEIPSTPGESAAPILGVASHQESLRDRYIVVFRSSVQDPDALTDQLILAHGGRVHYRYRAALKGFAATLPAAAVLGISRNPAVDYLEADGIMTIVATTQTNATWGLDRVDQRDLPLSGSYVYDVQGAGVHAYIIDTGIRGTHSEFTGRMGDGYTAINDGNGTSDCNGHGTHVAGTTGGTVYGVAKGVTLHPVRVLNCSGSGTVSGVVAGVDWVTANRVKPAVANMSLGGGASTTLDNAVASSINAGVTYAVAAGNSNANACNYSPARVGAALTVGATTSSDARASYSNVGSCLDLFAPGSSITSAWSTSNTATNTISGTSMASPHVAGVAALYLGVNPGASPAAVASAVTGNATPGKVSGAGTGSPNLLLCSRFGADLCAGGAGGGDGGDGGGEEPSVTIFVQGLSGSSAWANKSQRQWRATVTILVHNTNGQTVSGVTVAGTWSNGTSGSTSCTTGSNGTCAVTTGNVSSGTGTVQWTVGTLGASGATYDATLNKQNSIVIGRP